MLNQVNVHDSSRFMGKSWKHDVIYGLSYKHACCRREEFADRNVHLVDKDIRVQKGFRVINLTRKTRTLRH
jgi:hypothetical protein